MPPRRRHRANATENSHELEQRQERRERNAERRVGGRWLRRMLWCGLILAGFVLLAPNILGWTSLHQPLLNWALRDFNGQITVDRVSLGWFQTLDIQGVHVRSAENEVIADVASIRSTKRLFQFLSGNDYGEFEITRPDVSLVTREGGSNLEDAVAKFVSNEPTTDEPTILPRVNVKVIDGAIRLSSQRAPQPWTISHIDADVRTGESALVEARLDADVARDNQFGKLNVDFTVDEDQKALVIDNGRVHLTADGVSIGCLGPVMERVLGTCDLSGQLDGDLNLAFDQAGTTAQVQCTDLRIVDLMASAPSLLGSDVVRMNKVIAGGQMDLTPEGGDARDLQLTCDFGRLTTNGQFNWNQLARITEEQRLIETPFQMNADIDLAVLSRMLPDTFQLYEDLEVESGSLQCSLQNRPEQGASRMVVNLDTANIVAIRNGQRIAWQQPLRVVSVISQRNRDWSMDELSCESDFLKVTGRANQKSGNFEVNGDLSILMQRISQFVDLGGFNVKGIVDGRMTWNVSTNESGLPENLSLVNVPLAFNGQFKVDQPLIAIPGMKPWQDSELRATLGGLATALANGSAKIDSADARLTIGTERIELKLAEPVNDLTRQTTWLADCTITGSLARWLGHAGTFCDLSFLDTDGATEATGRMTFDFQTLELAGLKYQIQNWQFRGYGLNIEEPQVTGDGVLTFNLETGVTRFPELTVSCSSVAARGEDLTLAYADHLTTAGSLAFRADAHRVLNWLGMFAEPDSLHYFGALEGTTTFSTNSTGIAGTLSGKAKDLVVAQAAPATPTSAAGWNTLLREPNVDFVTQYELRHDFDAISFAGLQVSAPSVHLDANGSITELASRMMTKVEGTWEPDWLKIQSLLDVYAYKQVRLAGRQEQQFTVDGPMFGAIPDSPWPPQDLRVVTKVGWDQGNVFGLPVGTANVTAGIVAGQAIVETGDIEFSQGKLSLTSRMNLSDSNQAVTVDAGPILSNIALTPEICRDWMKYVAPLIADVTSAEGKVSLESKGAFVPLADLNQAQGRAEITLTDVTVGAGPLGKKLIETVETLRMILKPNAAPDTRDRSVWLRLEPQTVPIAIAQGRVFHDQMRIKVKDVTMTTKGSVGFDQTINMTAEIPILDEWIGGEKWLEGMKGQTIKVPITGTLTEPRLDVRAIQQLSTQIIQRTAQNQIQQQTEKLQNRLGSEIEKAQQKLGGELEKVQSKFNDSVQGDLMKGINGLFGPKKQD